MFGHYVVGDNANLLQPPVIRGDRGENVQVRRTLFVSAILMFSYCLVVGNQMSYSAAASVDCKVDGGMPIWNTTVAHHALKPEMTNDWREDEGREKKNMNSETFPSAPSEDSWMWDSERPPVQTLDQDLFASISVENDTSGALRFNLSKDYRYTFCVTISQPQGTSGDADIYMMTGSDYENYRTNYAIEHLEDTWWSDNDRDISDISPEWRSFSSIAGWNSFRDSHDYENEDEVMFTITLDEDLIWTPLFTNEVTWEEFYLVIDKWDNSRSDDSQPDGFSALVDVSVVVEERGFVLPPWTVSLTCLLLLFALCAAPVVLNSRYMKAGLELESGKGLVPQLATEEE